MNNGWICSYRSIWGHPFFKGNGLRVAVWHWLLHHAAWEDTTHRVGRETVSLKRGEVCFSQAVIQEATGASRGQVRDVVEWLISQGKASKIGASERARLGAKLGANPKTILLIENYEQYQNGGPRSGPDKEPTEQPIKEQGNKYITLDANASKGADAPSTVEVSVVSSAVWAAGKQFLASRGVDNPGAMIGRWLKSHSPLALLGAIESAQKTGTHDPVPYITQALSGKQEGFSVNFDLSKFEASK